MPNAKKDIRLILLSDTHLGFDFPVRPRIERRRRGPDFFANFQRVLDFAADNKADAVIHGGDFFFRARIPQPIVTKAYEMLFHFSDFGIPFLIVPGNHERSRLPESILFTHPNIFIFDKPRTYDLNLNALHLAISGFPFQRGDIRSEFSELWKDLQTSKKKADASLLVMHQAIEGAKVGPSDYTFRYNKDTIRMRDLPTEVMAVISGHIHRQQVLLKPNGEKVPIPVIFTGSTERTSFAEKDEDKGFYEMILGPISGKIQLKRLTFHSLPARPMIDIMLENKLKADKIEGYLHSCTLNIPQDAIVRINATETLDEEVLERMTASFLRSVLPSTMNYQFGKGFYMNQSHWKTHRRG